MERNSNKKPNIINVFIAILLCCVIILQVCLLIRYNNIEKFLVVQDGKIDSLSEKVNDGFLQQESKRYYEYEDLKNSLEQKSSLVEDLSVKTGSLNEDGRTAEVLFCVILNKADTETQVKIEIDEDIFVDMERSEGSTFEGVYGADIFYDKGHNHNPDMDCTLRVHIINEEGTVIEEVEEPQLSLDCFYSNFLANIDDNGNFVMSGYYENVCNGNICESAVKVTVDAEKIKKVKLVYEKNGEIIKEDIKSVSTSVVEFKNQFEVTGYVPTKAYILCEDEYGYIYRKGVFENFSGKSSVQNSFEKSLTDGIYDKNGNKMTVNTSEES